MTGQRSDSGPVDDLIVLEWMVNIWVVSAIGAVVVGDRSIPVGVRAAVGLAFGPLGLAGVWPVGRLDPCVEATARTHQRTGPPAR